MKPLTPAGEDGFGRPDEVLEKTICTVPAQNAQETLELKDWLDRQSYFAMSMYSIAFSQDLKQNKLQLA